jgi:hypothetical protein
MQGRRGLREWARREFRIAASGVKETLIELKNEEL